MLLIFILELGIGIILLGIGIKFLKLRINITFTLMIVFTCCAVGWTVSYRAGVDHIIESTAKAWTKVIGAPPSAQQYKVLYQGIKKDRQLQSDLHKMFALVSIPPPSSSFSCSGGYPKSTKERRLCAEMLFSTGRMALAETSMS